MNVKQGSQFIIMSKLGISLKDIFFQNQFKIKCSDSVKIGIKVLKALEKLHSIGIVHRDIKPDNFCFEYA